MMCLQYISLIICKIYLEKSAVLEALAAAQLPQL